MNVTEVAIGDIVLVEGVPMRITALTQNFVTLMTARGTEVKTVYGDIHPYPITEKLLEANGWMRGGRNHWFLDFNTLGDDISCVDIYLDEMPKMHISTIRDNFIHIELRHVHEMQHVLRLYRLDEAAEYLNIT